jgi:hypothetical protein
MVGALDEGVMLLRRATGALGGLGPTAADMVRNFMQKMRSERRGWHGKLDGESEMTTNSRLGSLREPAA